MMVSVSAISGLSTLIATWRSSVSSRARYTMPIAPRPMASTMWYCAIVLPIKPRSSTALLRQPEFDAKAADIQLIAVLQPPAPVEALAVDQRLAAHHRRHVAVAAAGDRDGDLRLEPAAQPQHRLVRRADDRRLGVEAVLGPRARAAHAAPPARARRPRHLRG